MLHNAMGKTVSEAIETIEVGNVMQMSHPPLKHDRHLF